jgi:hypothetical protein
MSRSRRTCLALLAGSIVWLIGLTVVPAAGATVTCSLVDATLAIGSDTDFEFAGVVRAGDELRVLRNQPFVEEEPTPVACAGGVPTVATTDSIVFDEASNVDEGGLQVDLGGGPFAPGATPEDDGTSEIEVTAKLNGDDGFLNILGSAGADSISYAPQGVGSGQVNLNLSAEVQPDFDVDFSDVEYPGIFGEAGPDAVASIAAPGAGQAPIFEFGLVVFGGKGRDVLVGASGVDQLFGDNGDDVVRGGGGSDLMDGGHGRDRLRAGAGSDIADAKDHEVDRVGCGSGRDIAFVDPRDRTTACDKQKKGFTFPGLPGFPEFLFPSPAPLP